MRRRAVQRFKLLQKARLLQHLLLNIIKRSHLPRCNDILIFFLIYYRDFLFFFFFALIQGLTLFLVFLMLSDSDRPQSQMVLKPLVLFLIVDEIGEKFPVTGSLR